MPITAIAGLATRRALALVLLVAFVLGLSLPAFAGTTGVLSGTITAAGNKPVAQAKISAVAPSGTYNATTDAKGFFSITGVQVDTYTVSITAAGYDAYALNGVTVNADQTTPIAVTLSTALRTIGRTSARSTTSAFQPAVTTDTYNLGVSQIQTQLGKKGSVSETALLASLPGASLDSSGYPVLRGGRENEEGFQFEGIDYTDAFSNQFVNSLALNNPGGFQLTPGAGDASSGNSGTGVINLLLKRGTYPAFGSAEFDVTARQYTHEFTSEYGFATPNGRFNNYATFTGQNAFNQLGYGGTDVRHIGQFFGPTYQTSRDFADVMTYKFGRDNNQKLEFVYQNQNVEFRNNAGGIDNLFYPSNDPQTLNTLRAFTGFTTAQIQALVPLYPLQTSVTQPLNFLSGDQQPNETYKLQYSFSPNSSTFLTAKYYQVNSTVLFDEPFAGPTGGLGFGDSFFLYQGGKRTGFQVDGTKQLNDKNLLKFGGKYEFVQPIDSFRDTGLGLFAVSFGGSFATNPEGLDFLPGGYLPKNGFNGFRVPEFDQAPTTTRQDWALYLDNTFTPTSKWNIDVGLRLDGTTFDFPDPTKNPELFSPNNPDGTFHMDSQFNKPKVWEPRLAASYQFTRNDALRVAYSRSVLLPPIADVDSRVNAKYYSSLPYANLPATDKVCGINNDQPCANYGQQLFWENQAENGIPIQPVKPETFSNFEASFSHQFSHGVAMRITPYYRRAFDAIVLASTVKSDKSGNPLLDVNGNFIFNPPVSSNLGVEKTTGVELYITKDNPGPGLSGSIAANYINEFSNAIPTSVNEDFFPNIPTASLLLGNLYRVGFLSPFNITAAVSYKTRSGFRVNPILAFNVGYPINSGLITSTFLGSTPVNVPQTNVTNFFGASASNQYVDTQNPGTVFKPNIAAQRGTPETASPGGILSRPRLTTANMSFEWSPPSLNGKGPTYGILVTNLFNQVYNRPALSTRFQPVATGIAGPQSGQTANAVNFPAEGNVNQGVDRFGNQPYIMTANQTPRTLRFYYQLAF